jgi:hypothetical protein
MHGNGILTRAASAQRKTRRLVQFHIAEKARAALLDWVFSTKLTCPHVDKLGALQWV